jgi:uncharacterized membrane protein
LTAEQHGVSCGNGAGGVLDRRRYAVLPLPTVSEPLEDRTHIVRRKKLAPGASHLHPVNQIHLDEATAGERLADRLASFLGSWKFIIGQSIFMTAWIIFNIVAIFRLKWDPYPFIFLNLILSFQATYAGPILLLAANRFAQKDRLTLEHMELEASMGDKQLRGILTKIKENTRYTNQILSELEAEKAL